ncbi:MAG: D-alanine--D-alanine ligase [Firmicutes bacterium]|nr:D-alanine--D-alanine ligase [Bacillota bacterium]
MTEKIRVGIIFGGRSSEHEVSLTSASCVLKAVDKTKYDIIPIGITKAGQWLVGDDVLALLSSQVRQLEAKEPRQLQSSASQEALPVSLLPVPGKAGLVALDVEGETPQIPQLTNRLDVVFPVLHGTYGEDGAIQGLMELADLPYIGAGITGSAVAMDKAIAKAVLSAGGFPQLPYLVVLRSQWEKDPALVQKEVESHLAYPCFVKPASLGSSVGISKVRNSGELQPALAEAAVYDRKFVIEKDAGNAREVECSVLGNDEPIASVPGEIIPSREFYDYVAKYHDDDSELIIPARISAKATRKVQDLAVQAFKALDCAGMARVDFFVDKATEEVYINEINTIPGFTPISMYPKLWEASGLPYGELIDRLIELAIERHGDKQRNETSFRPKEMRSEP